MKDRGYNSSELLVSLDDSFNHLETDHRVLTKNGYKSTNFSYMKGKLAYSATTNTYPFNPLIDEPINDNLITSANQGIPLLSN